MRCFFISNIVQYILANIYLGILHIHGNSSHTRCSVIDLKSNHTSAHEANYTGTILFSRTDLLTNSLNKREMNRNETELKTL